MPVMIFIPEEDDEEQKEKLSKRARRKLRQYQNRMIGNAEQKGRIETK